MRHFQWLLITMFFIMTITSLLWASNKFEELEKDIYLLKAMLYAHGVVPYQELK
jgi:hypothetical protein